ncbi:Ppx/GppA family phosphatase [Candidatus Auribacterota bacterium]
MIISAIDIGTNSVRYMSADASKSPPRVIEQDGSITRLGKNLKTAGSISPRAAAKTFKVIQKFVRRSRKTGAKHTVIAATSALRDAKNSDKFLQKIQNSFKIPAVIVSGEEEARTAFLGITNSLRLKKDSLLIDIGGGSTELIFTKGKKSDIISLNLGAVHLAEKYLYSDPPFYSEYKRMDNHIKKTLQRSIPSRLRKQHYSLMVGSGGTATTLAAVKLMLEKYDHERIHGLKMTGKTVDNILTCLQFSKLKDRKKIAGLKTERADIFPAGLYILINLMELFRFEMITVSDLGFLYGLIIKTRNTLNKN